MNTTAYNPMTWFPDWMNNASELGFTMSKALMEGIQAAQIHTNGVNKYLDEFNIPFEISFNAFNEREKEKVKTNSLQRTMQDYYELLLFNLQVAENGCNSTFKVMNSFYAQKATAAFSAWLNTCFDQKGDNIADFATQQRQLLEKVIYTYPEAIKAVRPEFGFHFDNGGYIKTAETDRFDLFQVLPTDKNVTVRADGKPVIIVHPYVLGANILAFLPNENRSYVHAFANQGIPTYVRVIKDINNTPAAQILTGEDDARDTRFFCEKVKAIHGREVTLNGFCQGGFIAVANILSGELDGLVDALITCVAPMDGTRSEALVEYMQHLPPRFRDLGYAVKSLPNGNQIVDGKVMSWVYKLKSMEREAPLFSLYRDLMMFDRPGSHTKPISKTAAAINHWLIYDRNDLPVDITQMSFDSYTIPVTAEGALPFKLFGRELNFKRLAAKNIPFLICYAKGDDLVDAPSALAPLDFIDAEVTVFPKGHGSIATSWSDPSSACALHTRFDDNQRGPVRFQLDLEKTVAKE
ncbi:metal transporter [Desulfococcaceae bacterium HSG9]|nr:metal transporter [Desulfococcaceae bacterium HSG9]